MFVVVFPTDVRLPSMKRARGIGDDSFLWKRNILDWRVAM